MHKFHFYRNTEGYLRISIKTLMWAFFDLVSPLLEIYPRVISTCIHKDIYKYGRGFELSSGQKLERFSKEGL